MPRSIKAFVWLSAAYVAWSLFWNFHLLIWPTAHYLEVHRELMAQTPPANHPWFERLELINGLTKTIYFTLPFVMFAIFAAFRSGWARWGVVLSLVWAEMFLPFSLAYLYLAHPTSYHYISQPLSQGWLQSYQIDVAHWIHWTGLILRVLLVLLLFLPSAKPWFRRSAVVLAEA